MTRSIARYATSPEAALSPSPRLGLLDRMFEAQVPKRLAGLTEGVLTIHDASDTRRFGARADDGLVATVRVHDPRFWRALALRGSMGAGEAYMDGWWSTENLTDVIRLFVRNRDALLAMEGGLARLAEPAWKLLHALKRNTITGSQRNIARHYDLSNEFFRLFLDETMTYSSGVFEHADATLTEASLAKIDRLCHKLELKPGDHLLEIGTGWGALAIRAAERFGCRVTSVTISQEQYELAKGRVEEAGLTERVEVRLQDYREILGTFDKVVSVEMIEAVGHQYFDTFFRVVSERLKPDGIAAIQAITIEDRLYKDARDSVDFIKRYIFPGCCIPAVSVLNNSV
ncbi:MAG: class I SAM-dependent methyltransferase, partial [Planctomycetota bacterium]